MELSDNKLEWNEPESVCEVTGYVVEMMLVNIDQCESVARPIIEGFTLKNSLSPSMVLPQPLMNFSTYAVTIQARSGDTAYGIGEANTTKFTTAETGELLLYVFSIFINIFTIWVSQGA